MSIIKKFLSVVKIAPRLNRPSYVSVNMQDALTISAMYGYNAVTWDARKWRSLDGVK